MRQRGRYNVISSKIIHMLVDRYELSQNQIAEILGVDKSFVSRVKSAERDLSTDQLRALAQAIDLPMALMFLQIVDDREVKPEHREVVEMGKALLRQSAEFDAQRRASKT